MKSFDNLCKTDEVISSSEIEDLEATARTLLETTSWLDWWMHTTKSLALCDKSDVDKIKCLFIAGSKFQLLVAMTAATIWTNMFLNCHDAVLGMVKINFSYDSYMKLHNASLSKQLSCSHRVPWRGQLKNQVVCSMMRQSGKLFRWTSLRRN